VVQNAVLLANVSNDSRISSAFLRRRLLFEKGGQRDCQAKFMKDKTFRVLLIEDSTSDAYLAEKSLSTPPMKSQDTGVIHRDSDRRSPIG